MIEVVKALKEAAAIKRRELAQLPQNDQAELEEKSGGQKRDHSNIIGDDVSERENKRVKVETQVGPNPEKNSL